MSPRSFLAAIKEFIQFRITDVLEAFPYWFEHIIKRSAVGVDQRLNIFLGGLTERASIHLGDLEVLLVNFQSPIGHNDILAADYAFAYQHPRLDLLKANTES